MPELQLNLHAKDLKNIAGVFGKSDPFAVVSLSEEGADARVELGQTETIDKTLDPNWTKLFKFHYNENRITGIAIVIYDKKRSDKKIMGTALFDVSTVLARDECVMEKHLGNGGMIALRLFKVYDAGLLSLMLRGLHLKDIEYFSKSDPFYELRTKIGSKWVLMYRSEWVKDELSPLWNETRFDLSVLCDGNIQNPLLISVYDYEASGKHRILGELNTTVSELLSSKSFGESGDANTSDRPNYLTLLDEKKKKAGSIVVLNAVISK